MKQSNIFKPKPYSFNDYLINNVVDRDVDYLIYKVDDVNAPINCRAIFDICINVSDVNYGEVVLSHFKEISSTNNIIKLCDVKFISPTREIDMSNANDISTVNLNKIVNHIKNILNQR